MVSVLIAFEPPRLKEDERVLQGYDQALMNGLLTMPTFETAFPSIDTSTEAQSNSNSTLQGTTVALYEVGAALGALSCYFIGDRFGRKWTTFGAAVTVLIGVIIQATSFDLAQLIVGRIVTGKSSTQYAYKKQLTFSQALALVLSQPQYRHGWVNLLKPISVEVSSCWKARPQSSVSCSLAGWSLAFTSKRTARSAGDSRLPSRLSFR